MFKSNEALISEALIDLHISHLWDWISLYCHMEFRVTKCVCNILSLSFYCRLRTAAPLFLHSEWQQTSYYFSSLGFIHIDLLLSPLFPQSRLCKNKPSPTYLHVCTCAFLFIGEWIILRRVRTWTQWFVQYRKAFEMTSACEYQSLQPWIGASLLNHM